MFEMRRNQLFLLLVILAAACGESHQANGPSTDNRRSLQQAEASRGVSSDHVVEVAGRKIWLSAARWKSMTNEVEWAVNFEEAGKGSKHEFGRVVTIYKLPMSDGRRLGVRISRQEYLELFVVHPGTVTAQIRIDKGPYWVLSRETFRTPSLVGVDTNRWHSLSQQEFELARSEFQAEIDSTRYLLQSAF